MQNRLVNVVPILPRITVILVASPERRGISSVQPRHQLHNSTTSTWNASFCECCCSVNSTYCCIVTCCPCTTIASVEENLGGSYDQTLLYFGGLALGFFMSIGFTSSSFHHSNGRLGSIKFIMWIAISAVLLMMFLFSVWRLRAQTRQKLGIHGSPFLDCLSSFFCCFCVVSQLYLELKCHDSHPRQQHYQRSQADNTFTSTGPADTLAPYVAM